MLFSFNTVISIFTLCWLVGMFTILFKSLIEIWEMWKILFQISCYQTLENPFSLFLFSEVHDQTVMHWKHKHLSLTSSHLSQKSSVFPDVTILLYISKTNTQPMKTLWNEVFSEAKFISCLTLFLFLVTCRNWLSLSM